MFLSSVISRNTSEELSLQASYLMENLSRVFSKIQRSDNLISSAFGQDAADLS